MIKNLIISCLCLSVISVTFPAATYGETAEDFWDYTFGTVARISKDFIAVLEYDFNKDEDVEKKYDVNESTEFVNFEALSALRIGDEVEIEFKEENNKRIAVEVVRGEEEKALLEEDFEQETNNGSFEGSSDKI